MPDIELAPECDGACAERCLQLQAELQEIVETLLFVQTVLHRVAGSVTAADDRARKVLAHYVK